MVAEAARVGALSQGTCPMCNERRPVYARARDIEYFSTPETFEYCYCQPCDVLYVNPMLKDKLDLIYPSNYYSFEAGGKKSVVVRAKEFLDKLAFRKLMKSMPGQTLKILDVGGGYGWLAGLLRDLDSRVTVTQIVDIDPAAKEAAEKAGHRYFCGPIEDFNSDEKFDIILMLNLIEHVADPAAILQKAQGMLSDTGVVYIKTPNFKALDARIFRHRNWGGYHCPRHFVLFCRNSIEATARRVGLNVKSFQYTQGAPFWSVSIFEQLRRLKLVKASAQRPVLYHPLVSLLQVVGAGIDFARAPFAQLSQMVVVMSKAPERPREP